jgi:hypothetical protein
MSENIAQLIQTAITASKEWPTKGWDVTFGPRKTPVNNLATAEAFDETFVYRLEAVAYWQRVVRSSGEAAHWGQKALDAFNKGDLADAEDCADFALLIEKPIREKAPVWEPVVKAIRKARGKAA